MVWPVQNDLTGAGGDRGRAGWEDPDREAEHRRQPRGDTQIRRDEHPDVDPVQGRAARGSPDRGETQGPVAPGDRAVPVSLPLSLGDEGAAVVDVQRRLIAIL